MKGHTAGKAHRRDEVIPFVDIWEQPVMCWLVSQAYHRVWQKISRPTVRWLGKWHQKIYEDRDDLYIPLTNRQDIRCDRLVHKRRTNLAIIYITQDQYNIITGKVAPKQEPRHEVKEPIAPPEPLPQQ